MKISHIQCRLLSGSQFPSKPLTMTIIKDIIVVVSGDNILPPSPRNLIQNKYQKIQCKNPVISFFGKHNSLLLLISLLQVSQLLHMQLPYQDLPDTKDNHIPYPNSAS